MLDTTKLKPRKHLSFDALIKDVHSVAEKLPDHRTGKCDYSITDAVMSAIAMFSLKDVSLLKFQERRNDQNLKDMYRIGKIPSDTSMRELLDPIEPDLLRPLFNTVFRNIQQSGELEPFTFLDGSYLLSVDGTEYFTFQKVQEFPAM